ncbi:MAG: transposase [Spirochaetaceae bacterium]|jgi:REP element-mobilizing transposase RayT|nr:transposase [Spirochaetaceae bacterium]
MRPLRELKQGVWYEIHTAVNNGEPLFQSRQALRLLARVLGDTAKRFDFEIRALCLKDSLLVFSVKPADGFQLPRIMQWLKQTFATRYNARHKRSGHIWGDRYWSRIADGEPPEEEERLSGIMTDAEEAELSPAGGRVRPLSGRVKAGRKPLSRKKGAGVRPFPWEPAKIPRKTAAPSA